MRLWIAMLVLSTCSTSDLGRDCALPESIAQGDPFRDFVVARATECDDDVCLRTKGSSAQEGFCSRACQGDRECDSGWACRQLLPSSVQIEGVEQKHYCVRP